MDDDISKPLLPIVFPVAVNIVVVVMVDTGIDAVSILFDSVNVNDNISVDVSVVDVDKSVVAVVDAVADIVQSLFGSGTLGFLKDFILVHFSQPSSDELKSS